MNVNSVVRKMVLVLVILFSFGAMVMAGTSAVNSGVTHQVIRGFGGSNAWSDCTSCGGSALNAWLVTNADKFFTTTAGIGLSIIRMRIPPEASQFGSAIAPVQAARDRGAIVMATEWTPPLAWKTVNQAGNNPPSSLQVSRYQDYANYLRDFVKTMKTTYNVDIHTICNSNEPDYQVTYDGCDWTGAQEMDFIRNYMGPTFQTAGLTTKIMVGESYANNLAISDATLNDTVAANYVSSVGVHFYGGGPKAYPLAVSKNKEYWMTEMSDFNAFDASMPGMGLKLAGWLHNGLVNAEYNAWIYWWLASDQKNEGITGVNSGMTKRYYVMGNYSKFVRPGYIRIDASQPGGTVTTSAYKEPTGAGYVVIATNSGTSAVSTTFNLTGMNVTSFTPYITSSTYDLAAQAVVTVSGNSFTYNLPAQSVVSFVAAGAPANTPTNTPFAGTPTNTATASPTPHAVMFDDMEDGNNTNSWGGNWYSYSGTGTTITPKPMVMTAGGMTGSLSYRAQIVATVADYAGMGTNLNAAETAVDLTNYTAIQFYVKGNGGSYWFQFTQPSITDGDNFGVAFTAPAAWTLVTIPIDAASLSQRGYGTASTFTKNAISALQWASNANGALDIQIDNVQFLTSLPTTPINTPVNTNTFTATNTIPAGTPTFTPTGGTGTNKVYAFTLDYSALPADIFKRMITLNVSVGSASTFSVTADGVPVTSTYTAATGTCSFSLDQQRTNIVVTAYNWTGGGTGIATKAALWENKKWAYSFTFDDNHAADYTIVYPYFSARGLRGGIGVVTNWIGGGGYLSRAQLDSLFNANWGIFNHSNSHAQSAIACANLATYVGAAKNTLESWYPNNYKSIYYIYPYLEMGYKTCLSTAGYVRAAEGVDGTNYVDNFASVDFYNLYRHGMYASVNASAANAWADAAATDARPRWNIVFTHNTVAGSGTPGTYDTNQATLEAHINYVYTTYGEGGATKNMWFAPSDEVLMYLYTRQYLVINAGPVVTPTTPVVTATFTPTYTRTPTLTPTATEIGTATFTPTGTSTPYSIMLDNMEDGNTVNDWGGNWYSYSGTGTTITPKPFVMTIGGVAGSANYNASILATVADYAGMGTDLATGSTAVDLTQYTAVEFYVKGNGGTYWFQFTQPSITDGDNFGVTFTAPAVWTKVTVQLDAALLAQRGFGAVSTFTKNAIAALQWTSNGNGALDIQVDNVRFLSLNPITPTLTPTGTNTLVPPTNTFTATLTSTTTFTPTFTMTNTPTETPTTPVATNTPITPTETPTTPVATNTPITPTVTPTTPVATNTPITPTATPTTPVATNTPITPSATPTTPVATNTPITPTATPTIPVPTNTPITPTATPTTPVPTNTVTIPTSTPTAGTASITFRFKSGVTGNTTNSPHPVIRVVNTGSAPVNLNNVEARYWFNYDAAAGTMQSYVDWAGKMPSGASVTGNVQVSIVATTKGGQTHYMSVKFTDGIILNPGEYVEVQSRFNKSDWSQMMQSNDWSYLNSQNFTDWNKVTGYISGNLVYGIEPSTTQASGATVAKVLSYPNPAIVNTGVTLVYQIAPPAGTSAVSLDASDKVYVLDPSAAVTLGIYTASGRLIWKTVLTGASNISVGEHSISWDGKSTGGYNLAGGTYTLKVEVKEPSGTNSGFSRIIIMR